MSAMKDVINAGIIGLGKMGVLHFGILNGLAGVMVKAIAEKEKFITNAVNRFLPSIIIYDDYMPMLEDESLDLVYITTPTSLHTQIVEACLDRGINFFVEKPLGVSSAECESLVKKFQKKPVINMVGYYKRFVDTFIEAKKMLDNKTLGEPVYLKSHMYVSQLFSEGSGWRYKRARGGGALNVLATHLIDLLLWFFGDINSVHGNVKSHYSKDVEDFAHSYLEFKNGLSGYLDVSWSIRRYRLLEISLEVQCTKGMLIVTEDYVKYLADAENKFSTLYKQDLFQGVEIDIGGPEYTLEDKHMIECVRTQKQTDVDVLHGYKVQCVTDAIYDSALRKAAVDITI